MPVLVTEPGTATGTALVAAIAATGGQVRAFCGDDDPVAQLRQLGAVCATGSLLDEGHLETAMEQVHTVVHLGVQPLADDPEQLTEEAATVVAAAVGAGVRSLIVVSVPGASADAGDALRVAAAEVEQLADSFPGHATVVRPSLVDDDGLRSALARTALDQELLETPVAPVPAADLATLIAGLDDRRSLPEGGRELLAADGARTVPLREYLRRVGIVPMSLAGRLVRRLRGEDTLAGALRGPWTSPELRDAWSVAGVAAPDVSDGGASPGGAPAPP